MEAEARGRLNAIWLYWEIFWKSRKVGLVANLMNSLNVISSISGNWRKKIEEIRKVSRKPGNPFRNPSCTWHYTRRISKQIWQGTRTSIGAGQHRHTSDANSWITSLKKRSTQLVPYGTSAFTANCPRSWPRISATRLWRSDSNYCRSGRVGGAAASTAPSVSLRPAMCAASKRSHDAEEQSFQLFSVFSLWKLRNVLVGDYSELDIIRSN